MRFIARTSLAGLVPLVVGDRPLLEDYVRLQDLLRARGGEPASRLFAQPVITWGNGAHPGSVAWYTDAAGEAEPLAGLPDARRAVIGGRLQAALAVLWPMRSDPLVAAALTLASSDGVMAVGDEPVLIGWGLAASDQPAPADAAALAAAFGPYLPAAPPPVPVAMSPPPPPLPPPAIPIPVAPALPQAGRELPWLLPAGLAVLAVCLALGIWFGLWLFARRTSFAELGDPAMVRAAIDLAEAQNRGLAAAIAAQRKVLAGNVCRLASAPAAGPLAAPVAPSSLSPAATKPFHGSLLALLHQATVMVAATAGPGVIVTGSGFFFAPDLVLTNRHVVAEAKGPIEVISKALGRPVVATIIAETPNSVFFQPDFAVLKVAAARGIQPLAFSPVAAQLDRVIATGFPGAFLLEAGNQAYAQLAGVMGGDMTKMPAMIATEGRISAIQTAPSGLMIMPHTAQISTGNSGGPLVDACGRVLGINTFTRDAAQQIVHINYAQKTDSALAFLAAHQIAVTPLATPCAPAVPAPLPPTPAPPGKAAAK
ncbi:MAG TPA: serine protease [Acetobacteraceae bacterium]|nr:serine protease [Acetobacteraceae bacterium]